MPSSILEFEKPLVELEAKIAELRKFSEEKGINLASEIQTLEQKAQRLKEEIYQNLNRWQRVMIARHSERPTVADYIKLIMDNFIELHGDRTFGDDPAIMGGIGKLAGRPVTVIGQVKGHDTKENLARNFGMSHPEGYRKALRLMHQAEKFGRPVICFIDTPGAYCGITAEERGVGEAIARNLVEMMALKAPVIAVIIGEGGSGGALALGIGDRVLMLENAVYSVISPESFGAIIWKDSSRASEAAELLKLTARDLKGLEVIDEVIAEPLGGAHKNHNQAAQKLKEALLRNLAELEGLPAARLTEERYNKFRRIGKFLQG
ncbi:MAG: acetyl-CoA carboxylase carboxyltransferase subunit alpha [Clostridia bacterium]|nr:acetyl-CoA carboxylase carboxyltransferase subunit alpha [Clostridia bacterium]